MNFCSYCSVADVRKTHYYVARVTFQRSQQDTFHGHTSNLLHSPKSYAGTFFNSVPQKINFVFNVQHVVTDEFYIYVKRNYIFGFKHEIVFFFFCEQPCLIESSWLVLQHSLTLKLRSGLLPPVMLTAIFTPSSSCGITTHLFTLFTSLIIVVNIGIAMCLFFCLPFFCAKIDFSSGSAPLTFPPPPFAAIPWACQSSSLRPSNVKDCQPSLSGCV